MNPIRRIALDEWRLLWRDRVAVMGLVLITLLSVTAALTAWHHREAADADRAHHQSRANQEFDAQPDRHPHRMVHYGHFVFRSLNPLAAFDPGIDAYTGQALFLEGHRQNSANFGDVRQSSLLVRFGHLTPAFVLQVLAPLLLVFLGHGVVARERESGTLRTLLAQGVRPRHIVLGKLLALCGLAGLVLVPTTLALGGLVIGANAPAWPVLALWAGHAAWLLLWAMAVTAVSAWFGRRRDALLCLLAIWTVSVIVLPRIASESAASAHALPTRFETDIAVARDLAALGDSHDPDDPYFNRFRQRVLAQYGVTRVEDLPVNYKGLLGIEGERMTSALFDRYAEVSFDQQARQSRWMDTFALVSPALAIRRLSMGAAGTDLEGYRRFLEQGERHRYRLVQALNTLQAERLTYADDRNPAKENRLAPTAWQGEAEFHHEPAPPGDTLRRAVPAAAALALWLAVAAALLLAGSRHLAGSHR